MNSAVDFNPRDAMIEVLKVNCLLSIPIHPSGGERNFGFVANLCRLLALFRLDGNFNAAEKFELHFDLVLDDLEC